MGRSLTVTWWLIRALARAAELLAVALILAGRWAIPRGWRLAVRGGRTARRWYVTRPQLLPAEPAPPAAPVAAPTLDELRRTKQEANVS